MASPELKGPFAPSENVLIEMRAYEEEHGPLSDQEREAVLNMFTDAEFDQKHLPAIERQYRADQEATEQARQSILQEEVEVGEEIEARAKIENND